jgi:medium-chain acyl-[acyl-carrier-protein] hydrolase
MIKEKTGDSGTNLWLTRFRPNAQARMRLFCFPYAGGGALIYRTWHESLPPNVELCAVQLPGRGNRLRESPFTNMPQLVEAVAAGILPYLDKPFAFFGHSMGALIGFELAHRLRSEHGLEPSIMFVSGRRAPQTPETDRITYNLPEDEFIEELRRLNGTPREVFEHPELMQLMIPLLRADFEVCQTYAYSPKPPLKCAIAAFGGLQDFEVTRSYLEGWRDHTSTSFSLSMLPGDHFFLHSYAATLLQRLSQELQKVLTLMS